MTTFKDAPPIRVGRKDFIQALKRISLAMPPRMQGLDVRIEFNGTLMQLSAPGAKAEIAAEGEAWAGFALVPFRPIKAVARGLPINDPLTLKFEDGRFYIERWSYPGMWQNIGPAPLDMPLMSVNPSILKMLKMDKKESPAKVLSSGLAGVVAEAEEKAQSLIERAALILRPLGITEADLQELLQKKLGG